MIRRPRISVRPSVKPKGRAETKSRETPQGNETFSEPSNYVGVKAGDQDVITEVKASSTDPASETNTTAESQSSDITSQSELSVTTRDVTGQTASISSLSMRRKRFSVLPNFSKPRSTPASSKLPKSAVRPEPTPETPPPTYASSDVFKSPNKHESTREPAQEPPPISSQSLPSLAPKLFSSSIQKSTLPSKAVITTEFTPGENLSASESVPELPPAPVTRSDGKSKQRKHKPVTSRQDNTETSANRLKEVESQSANQDAVESSCPNEDDPAPVSKSKNEHVDRDGCDLESPGKRRKPQQHVPLALRTLNDPVDRLRLARAKKLRELLKKEINKEKKKEKHQRSPNRSSEHKIRKDHAKMTMRELIYYLPSTNPMKSYSEDVERAEMDFPSSPKAAPAVQAVPEENAAEEEEEEPQGGEEEERAMAPRVKVAEDGSLIIDEESLTVQVHRMRGPNLVEEKDPIFERGSTTTYSSFRRGIYAKPWSNRETDMFFLAISMVGMDFSMIGQLFPHRARVEIKNKFKKEERANSWRIDKAFKEKRRLDLDFFNKLLEHILKDEKEKRKKQKHASHMAKLLHRRLGERKRKIHSSDSEEEESSSSDTMEVEKEKENVCGDGGRERRRVRASQKKSKHVDQSAEQEAEEEAERSVNDTSAREERAKKSTSYDSEDEEEPDMATIQEHILNKPTRSGRIPKLSQHMIRAAACEEEDDEAEQLPLESRSRATKGKRRNPGRGRSKLLTLRASAAEEEEDEEEEYDTNQEEDNYLVNVEEENQAFVPMGLRSVATLQNEVEETMEELDISVNVPDVLGISQNDLCPESSCERALAPMGPVPCEHQLDLLVDVIEFLAPDHMEVSEEAARTLLTIGHSAHLAQTEEPSSTGDVIIIEESSTPAQEEVLTEMMDQYETRDETLHKVTSDPCSIMTSEAHLVSTVSTGDASQYSVSVAEPVSSQESNVPCSEFQPETSDLTVPEPTNIQRNCLPKLNFGRSTETARTTMKKPAETFSASLQTETVASHRSPEEHSEVLLEKSVADEAKEESQKTHSESKSHSLDSVCFVKPSQPIRRCRGPKPKPNLVRSIRTTPTITHVQNLPEVPDENQAAAHTCTVVKQPEEGVRIISEPERETPSEPVTVISDPNPEELPRSVCEASTAHEPVFILSLTEVLPTLTEGMGCGTDPCLPSATAEPIRSIEQAVADDGGLGPAGDQVSSQLLLSPSPPVTKKRETENGDNERNRGNEEDERTRTQDISASGRSDEPPEPSPSSRKIEGVEVPVMRRKLPESTRRAKLQIKPNTVQRKTRRDLPSSDKMRSAPTGPRETMSEDTEPRETTSLILISSTASTDEPSVDKNGNDSTEQSPVPSPPPPARTQTPPPQPSSSSSSSSSSPSQCTVGNINLPETKSVKPNASEVGTRLQPGQKITPLASTGSLTRAGRRPKGFLSFMSSTNTQRSSESTRTSKKPVITSRPERRRTTPSTSASPSFPTVSSHKNAETSRVNPSAGEDEEPTSVAAYFFNDIFTEVDEEGEPD